MATAGSSPFRLSKIGLIQIGATDLDQSISFYRDRLGLELTGQSPEFAFFNGGGVMLMLSRPIAQALGASPGSVEVVFSVDHVREAYTQLVARGVEFRNEPRVVTGAMWSVNFADPDGRSLSLFGPE